MTNPAEFIYRDDIREKLIVVDYGVIVNSVLTLNTSAAFAINEHIFGVFKTLDYELHDFYYEMDEKLRK